MEFGWWIVVEKKEILWIRIISIICGVMNYLFFCIVLIINIKLREWFYVIGFNLWFVWFRFSIFVGMLNLIN